MPIQYADPAPAPEAGQDTCMPPIGAITDENHDEFEYNYDNLVITELGEDDVDMLGTEHVEQSRGKYVPPSFFQRESYCELDKEGLVTMPSTEGLRLWCHVQSQQWHAVWVPRRLNCAPTWGGKRSEMMSLLMAVRQLWVWHLSVLPEDCFGKSQLKRIQDKMSETGF